MLCLVGDGGLGMALAELETLARLALPVTVVVFDDAALSLIEIKQGAGQGGPAAVRYRPVDFAAVAAGFGVPSAMATSVSGVDSALASVAGPGPFLLDARIDPAGYREVLRVSRRLMLPRCLRWWRGARPGRWTSPRPARRRRAGRRGRRSGRSAPRRRRR